jgi:hypothetical protein
MPRETKAPEPLPNPAAARRKQLQQLRTRLEAERRVWARRLSRLKRAFGAFLKSHACMARVERRIAKLQEPVKQDRPTNP